MDQQEVSLSTLAGGAAVERFDDALQQVLANIFDPNTEPGDKRRITLEVVFEPNSSREKVETKIKCSVRLAPPMSWSTELHIGQTANGPRAYEAERRQLTFDDFVGQPDASASDIARLTRKA